MRQWLFPALMEIGMLGMFFAAAAAMLVGILRLH